VVEEATVVVQSHGVNADHGFAFGTKGPATDDQIIQALQDDAFRPIWHLVSDELESI